MWRPGKLRFLIGVKNPLPIDRPRPPENTAPCGAPPVARFATPVGLRPPFVAHPATLPHPDRRALLILFAAQHRSKNTAVSSVAWRGTTREYSAVGEQPVSVTVWWRMQ